MSMLKATKTKIFIKLTALIIAQVFFVTSLGYAGPIYDTMKTYLFESVLLYNRNDSKRRWIWMVSSVSKGASILWV